MYSAMPGYWEQNPDFPDAAWCSRIETQKNLTTEEKFIACKTQPRFPPKIVDRDLLDNVVSQIKKHDYEEGPILQVFATQSVHIPMQYPKEYDRDSELTVPEHFREGAEKPAATADDMRLTTSHHLRFVDDLFGSTMEAIKDAGQWDNTIVFFTSDNGGAIVVNSVNNNYPLRGAKFSNFEGKLRFHGCWSLFLSIPDAF